MTSPRTVKELNMANEWQYGKLAQALQHGTSPEYEVQYALRDPLLRWYRLRLIGRYVPELSDNDYLFRSRKLTTAIPCPWSANTKWTPVNAWTAADLFRRGHMVQSRERGTQDWSAVTIELTENLHDLDRRYEFHCSDVVYGLLDYPTEASGPERERLAKIMGIPTTTGGWNRVMLDDARLAQSTCLYDVEYRSAYSVTWYPFSSHMHREIWEAPLADDKHEFRIRHARHGKAPGTANVALEPDATGCGPAASPIATPPASVPTYRVARWSLMPWHALEHVANVLTEGAAKHGDLTYREPSAERDALDMDAVMRHVSRHCLGGSHVMDESGEPSLAHAAARLLMLIERMK